MPGKPGKATNRSRSGDLITRSWSIGKVIMVISVPDRALRNARKAGVAHRKSPIREARSSMILWGGSGKRESSPGTKGSFITYLLSSRSSLERIAQSSPQANQVHTRQRFLHYSEQ